MPHDQNPPKDIVIVGVSPTSGSPVALRWAALEAGYRRVSLVAVRAWRPPRPPSAPAGRPSGISRDLEAEVASARNALRLQVKEAVPDAKDIICTVEQGTPLAVLLRKSVEADLLVIDAPPRSDLSQLPLLAHRLVYRAKCPVMIMPPTMVKQRTTSPGREP